MSIVYLCLENRHINKGRQMGEVIVTNTSESFLQTSMLKNHIRTCGDKRVNIQNYGSLGC